MRKSGKLLGNLWIALKLHHHRERTSGEVRLGTSRGSPPCFSLPAIRQNCLQVVFGHLALRRPLRSIPLSNLALLDVLLLAFFFFREGAGEENHRRKKAFFLRYPQIFLNPRLLNPHLRHSKLCRTFSLAVVLFWGCLALTFFGRVFLHLLHCLPVAI